MVVTSFNSTLQSCISVKPLNKLTQKIYVVETNDPRAPSGGDWVGI